MSFPYVLQWTACLCDTRSCYFSSWIRQFTSPRRDKPSRDICTTFKLIPQSFPSPQNKNPVPMYTNINSIPAAATKHTGVNVALVRCEWTLNVIWWDMNTVPCRGDKVCLAHKGILSHRFHIFVCCRFSGDQIDSDYTASCSMRFQFQISNDFQIYPIGWH